MPPGGDGFYYFSTYLLIFGDEYGLFEIFINGQLLCSAYAEQLQTSTDEGQPSCSAITYAAEGW